MWRSYGIITNRCGALRRVIRVILSNGWTVIIVSYKSPYDYFHTRILREKKKQKNYLFISFRVDFVTNMYYNRVAPQFSRNPLNMQDAHVVKCYLLTDGRLMCSSANAYRAVLWITFNSPVIRGLNIYFNADQADNFHRNITFRVRNSEIVLSALFRKLKLKRDVCTGHGLFTDVYARILQWIDNAAVYIVHDNYLFRKSNIFRDKNERISS